MTVVGVGLLCGIAGLLLAGFLAQLCVKWFHVSGFEGASGYMVVLVALLGGLAGFVIGAIAAWNSATFGRALVHGMGIVAGIGAVAFGIARLTGDVPPTWGGEELAVAAEVEMPAGWKPSNRIRHHGLTFELARVGGTSSWHRAEWRDARQQDGRWIIPGHAHIFTRKGERRLRFRVYDDPPLAEVGIPLPANPGPELAAWSDWKPAGALRFRFRVRKSGEIRQEEEARLEKIVSEWKQRVISLSPEAPLADWVPLVYTDDQVVPDDELRAKVFEVIRGRPSELAPLLTSPDPRMSLCALRAVGQLYKTPVELEAPLRAAATILEGELKAYAAAFDPADPDQEGALSLKLRFIEWTNAWGDTGKPAPQEMIRVGQAAAAVPEGTEIGAIRSLAENYAKEWAAK